MKYRLFLMMATFVGLGSINTSCSRDNEPVVSDGDQKTPISFNVNIGSLPAPTVTTRGELDNKTTGAGYYFNENDKICIAIKGVSGSSRDKTTEDVKTYKVLAANAGSTHAAPAKTTLTYDGTATDGFLWLSTTEKIALRAWSNGTTTAATDPLAKDASSVTIPYELEKDQATNGYKELLYYSNSSIDYNASGIDIPLYHQLSRIVATIEVEDATAGAPSVTIGHNSDGNRVPVKGTFAESSTNYGSWTVSAYATATAAHWGVVTPRIESTTPKTVYSAVIIPGTAADIYKADLRFFNITVGSKTFAYKLPTGGQTFEAGKQYNYTITVGNQGITVTSNITDWTDAVNGTDFTHGDELAWHSRLPIEYVAPYDMKSATEMATDNHVNNSYYFYGGGTSFSQNLVNFINGTAYPGYHLPSTFEWMSILPPYYGKDGNNTSETFDVDGGNRIRLAKGNGVTAILGEIAGWGVKNNSGAYTYEVYRKFYNQYNWPAGSNVSYAIRFMENSDGDYGIYTCAYRYTYNDVSSSIGSNSLTIDVKYIGLDETVTISTISNSSWWSSVDFTVTMPACGWLNTEADAAGSSYSGANAKLSTYYWSATPNDIAGYGYQARFYDEFIDGNGPTPLTYSYSVRLFRDRQ